GSAGRGTLPGGPARARGRGGTGTHGPELADRPRSLQPGLRLLPFSCGRPRRCPASSCGTRTIGPRLHDARPGSADQAPGGRLFQGPAPSRRPRYTPGFAAAPLPSRLSHLALAAWGRPENVANSCVALTDGACNPDGKGQFRQPRQGERVSSFPLISE